MEANYPYAIKNQRGASIKPLVESFGCEELVLYGIRDTAATPRKSPQHRDGPHWTSESGLTDSYLTWHLPVVRHLQVGLYRGDGGIVSCSHHSYIINNMVSLTITTMVSSPGASSNSFLVAKPAV